MKADLYIATRSDRSDIVKVGRSANVKQRCSALSASQCFTVSPSHVYPGCGGLEKAVHEALQRHRVDGGSGKEWFRLTAAEAKCVVDRIKAEVDNKPSYGYELMMAELGMGPYPREPLCPPPPVQRKYVRRYEYIRSYPAPIRRRRGYEACVDMHRPPMTTEEVLRSICRSCEA